MLIGFVGGRIVQASWSIGSKSSDPRFLYRRHSAGLDRAGPSDHRARPGGLGDSTRNSISAVVELAAGIEVNPSAPLRSRRVH